MTRTTTGTMAVRGSETNIIALMATWSAQTNKQTNAHTFIFLLRPGSVIGGSCLKSRASAVRASLHTIHTYTHTYIHTYTHVQPHIHTYIHTYIHAHVDTHTWHTRTYIPSRIHTSTYTYHLNVEIERHGGREGLLLDPDYCTVGVS